MSDRARFFKSCITARSLFFMLFTQGPHAHFTNCSLDWRVEDEDKVYQKVECDKTTGHIANLELQFDVCLPVTETHDCVQGIHQDNLVEQLHFMLLFALERLDVG